MYKKRMKLFLFSFIFLISFPLFSQKEVSSFDTTHSPKKAVILSAILPGAGQVYNKKWWKVPIIYAGLGTSVYFFIRNNREYHLHRDEYLYRINNGGLTQNPDLEIYSEGNLRTIIDQYQKWRDLSVVAIAGVYALQLVDAAVDGYLFRLDTSNDLSFHFRPSFIQTPYSFHPALRVKIKF
jgi:hypothetical protein